MNAIKRGFLLTFGQVGIARLVRLPFFREFVLFATSSVLFFGSRFAVSFVAAKLLGPSTWGFWNMLNLILVYGCLSHFGVINAMNRDVPLLKGKGESERVEAIRRVSLTFITISALVVVGMIVAAAVLLVKDTPHKIALVLVGLLFLCTQFYSYLEIYLKSDGRFRQMSHQQLLFAGVIPLVSIPLVLKLGLPGFILGQSVALLVISVFIATTIPFDFKLKIDRREVRRLVKVGFPIMVAGLLYGLMTTVDRWVIASFLGVGQVGFYSLSIMVTGFLTLVPLVIAQQIYPRMAESFGQNARYQDLKKWVVRQILMAVSITTPLVLAVYFFFPLIVRQFMPAYIPGIGAMKISLIGLFFLPLAGGFGNFLNTVDRQVYYTVVQAGAILLNLLLDILFVKIGFGINGVALGAATSYTTYSLALLLVGAKVIRGGSRSSSLTLKSS